MKFAQASVLAIAAFLTLQSRAQSTGFLAQHIEKMPAGYQKEQPGYYQIDPTKTEIQELETTTLSRAQFDSAAIGSGLCGGVAPTRFSRTFEGGGDWIGNVVSGVDQVDMIVDKVINIGKKIWAVVEKGRPVVNLKLDVATALPAGAKCWLDLQRWQAPVSKAWTVSFKNLYGVEVVKYTYRVVYLAGGSVDGVGQYIGFAAIQPVELSVAWGYTVNSEVNVPAVYNLGTRSNPVGGLNLEIKWSVETVLKKIIQSQSFTIDGRGNLTQLQ